MTAARNATVQSLYETLINNNLRQNMDWNQVTVLESAQPAEVLGQALQREKAHILQTKNPHFNADLNSVALMSKDRDAFGHYPMSTILAPERYGPKSEKELTIFEYNFTKSIQKGEILEGVEAALDGLSISASVTADLMVIADELTTNAIFNAPFVDLENTKPGASRELSDVSMTNGKSAQIMMASDENRVVIGCRDMYGSLNMSKLFRRIKNCYDTSVGANINLSGNGGAGIGSYMIFNSSASFFAEVKVLSQTMICCTVPLRMSSRARFAIAKDLHFSVSK